MCIGNDREMIHAISDELSWLVNSHFVVRGHTDVKLLTVLCPGSREDDVPNWLQPYKAFDFRSGMDRRLVRSMAAGIKA